MVTPDAMGKVQLQKNWTITPNVRLTPFVSLVATMGWFVYQNKTALLAAGWTVKFSCDGATGPADASDATDRITSAAAFATRAAVAAAAQSWIVLQNAEGVQLLFTYQGASDDIMRIEYSAAGLYALAGTTTNQPTATDALAMSAGNSIVNSTASADRVMSIWATGNDWSCFCYRVGGLAFGGGVEKIDPIADTTSVFPIPYVGYRYSNTNRGTSISGSPAGGQGAIAIGAAGWVGTAARINTAGSGRSTRLSGGEIASSGGGNFNTIGSVNFADQCALQGGVAMPLLPLYWFGEKNATMDGVLGCPIDWWAGYSSSSSTPAPGDFFPALDVSDAPTDPTRTNWLVALGSAMIRPWKSAAVSFQTT